MQSSAVRAARARAGDNKQPHGAQRGSSTACRRTRRQAARPFEERKATIRQVRITQGAGNMMPVGSQHLITQRTPAAWRAHVRRRRAWLIAAELDLRQRPQFRRTRALTPISP